MLDLIDVPVMESNRQWILIVDCEFEIEVVTGVKPSRRTMHDGELGPRRIGQRRSDQIRE